MNELDLIFRWNKA